MKYIISALLFLLITTCCFSQVTHSLQKHHFSKTDSSKHHSLTPHTFISHHSAIGKTMPDGSIVYPDGYTIKPLRENKVKPVYTDSGRSIRGTGRDYPAGIKK